MTPKPASGGRLFDAAATCAGALALCFGRAAPSFETWRERGERRLWYNWAAACKACGAWRGYTQAGAAQEAEVASDARKRPVSAGARDYKGECTKGSGKPELPTPSRKTGKTVKAGQAALHCKKGAGLSIDLAKHGSQAGRWAIRLLNPLSQML